MDQVTIWLGIIWMVTMSVLVLPSVVRMNQGKMIRNAALWLAIVFGLALFYRVFGPFDMAMNQLPANTTTGAPAAEEGGRPKLIDDSEAPSSTRPLARDSYAPPDEE